MGEIIIWLPSGARGSRQLSNGNGKKTLLDCPSLSLRGKCSESDVVEAEEIISDRLAFSQMMKALCLESTY